MERTKELFNINNPLMYVHQKGLFLTLKTKIEVYVHRELGNVLYVSGHEKSVSVRFRKSLFDAYEMRYDGVSSRNLVILGVEFTYTNAMWAHQLGHTPIVHEPKEE